MFKKLLLMLLLFNASLTVQAGEDCSDEEHFKQGTTDCIYEEAVEAPGNWLPLLLDSDRFIQGTDTYSDAVQVSSPGLFLPDCFDHYRLIQGTSECIFSVPYDVTSSGVTYLAGVYSPDYNETDRIMDMELSSDGSTLYIALKGNGLSVVNLSTGSSERIDTGMYSRYVKLSNDGSTAYVTASSDKKLSFIDLEIKSVTSSILIADYAIGIAVADDGSTLYIGAKTEGIATVDVEEETVTHVELMNGGDMTTVILSADETKVYGSESSDYGLTTYNPADDTFSTINTLSGNAYDFDIMGDESTAYVSSGNNDAGVDIVSVTNQNVSETIYNINANASEATYNIDTTSTLSYTMQVKLTYDDKLLFIADRDYDDTLFVVDIENNHAISFVVNTGTTSCIEPNAVEISADNSKVYLGCSNGVVAEFDIK